jgi:nitrite reductase (NADH) large subunit
MEGGIERLREIVIEDNLGICCELEQMMQHLVDTYRCEWTEVVNDPERRRLFSQFVNTDETETGIEIVTERGQARPADWPKEGAILQIEALAHPPAASTTTDSTDDVLSTQYSVPSTDPPRVKPNGRPSRRSAADDSLAKPQWTSIGRIEDFPVEGGAAIKYGDVQIAVFNFASRGEWYACQNMCPHKKAFILSRGIIGTQGEAPKVACPLHKKTFSLESGECLSGEDYSVKTFPVRVVDGEVFLLLPAKAQLNALLGTSLHCITSCSSTAGSPSECAPAESEVEVCAT